MARRAALALASVATAALAPAGSGAGATPGQLAAMPLPRAQFGEIARGFSVERRVTGRLGNAKKAAETVNPRDTARSLTAAGRLDGYEVTFSDPKLAALGKVGYLEARSQVAVYRTIALARAAALREVADFRTLDGRPIGGGVRLGAVSMFSAAGVPGALTGIRSRFDVAGVRLFQTSIAFVHGRLLAGVSIVRADPRNVDATAVKLAGDLVRRIDRVLATRPPEPGAA